MAGDLVSYWPVDDGVSNQLISVMRDAKGTNHGTLVRPDSTARWLHGAAAMFEGALELEGASSSVNLPQNAALDIGTNGLTISVWLNLRVLPSQLSSSFGAVFDSTADSYVLYLDKNNKELRFKVTDTSGHAARPGISESLLGPNRWIHVAGTYSGRAGPVSGQAVIYLNGVARDVHTGHDGTSPVGLVGNIKPGQQASLGREGSAGASYFGGAIDDLALWRRALSSEEVRAIYDAGRLGHSLKTLLGTATTQIQLRGAWRVAENQLHIVFACPGPWQKFQLLRGAQPEGPFWPVVTQPPTSLGARNYRFTAEVGNEPVGYFRVEAE
jgi:hypothetical protein